MAIAAMAAAPAILSILGKIFGGDKKPVELQSKFDPPTEKFRQSMMASLSSKMNQPQMYARTPLATLQRSDFIRNSLFPQAQAANPYSYTSMPVPGTSAAQNTQMGQGAIGQGQSGQSGMNPALLASLLQILQQRMGSGGATTNMGLPGGGNPQQML